MMLGFAQVVAFGDWAAKTEGLPPVETITARTMGAETTIRTFTTDRFGRLFVGSNRLLVFEGQNWKSVPKTNNEPLISLATGPDGKIWAGSTHDFGYFEEVPIGIFQYHSLSSHWPKGKQTGGPIVGCAPVGSVTYFIFQQQVVRWDGTKLEILPFETNHVLHSFKMEDEWWFFHFETGLYRLTEKGPVLEIPSAEIDGISVAGLFRDKNGLVVVGNSGFIRPGNSTVVFSQQKLNDYLAKHQVNGLGELPDGNIVIGTVSGGVVMASRAGELIRIWSMKSGLPRRSIQSLGTSPSGEVWGVTEGEFFHFSTSGDQTLFDSHNGLQGQAVTHLQRWNSDLLALTEEGGFRLIVPSSGQAYFQALPPLGDAYFDSAPLQGGLLLSRAGGLDLFDGSETRTVYHTTGNPVLILPPVKDPNQFYVAEASHLARLALGHDGSMTRKEVHKIPDTCTSLYEDPAGQIWLGTQTKGAFRYDSQTDTLSPIGHPITRAGLTGNIRILGDKHRTLIFSSEGVFRSDPEEQDLQLLDAVPSLEPIEAGNLPGQEDILIVYKRTRRNGELSQGTGILSFDDRDKPQWSPLDISALSVVGQLRTFAFSKEESGLILWLGGTDGILRVEYEKIKILQPPAAPIVRLDGDSTGNLDGSNPRIFSFRQRNVRLMVMTGESVLNRETLIQIRFGTGSAEWSTPATQRLFEFPNLSEGSYFVEARSVNSAGAAGPSTRLNFIVLAPWYRTKLAYAGYCGAFILAALILLNLRERRIERRNQQLKKLVEIRSEELAKACAAKDEFLSNISHEILNPMNGIIGIVDTIQAANSDDANRHQLDLLRHCAKHLSSLLEDILDFSRVQANGLKLDTIPFDLAELMESVAAITSTEAKKRNIPVKIAVSPDVPRNLIGDPRRIRQILLNYIGNALKFSGRGQVDVTVWRNNATPDAVEVFFAVSDEGLGIAPKEQAKLFSRFERGCSPRTAGIPGTGLGLAHCKNLAEKMGGKVWLKSQVGEGSCFYFGVALAISKKTRLRNSAPAPEAGVQILRALVVDDEEYNRIALAGLIEGLGISVNQATGYVEALALAEAHDFDFIFLDYSIPGREGPEIALGIRKLPNPSARAMIVATTAFHTAEKRAACLAAGMDVFLDKPVTLECLREAIGIGSPKPDDQSSSLGQPRPPKDKLANLRLLASKKGVSFASELAACFSDLEFEMKEINAALCKEDSVRTAYYAHLLQGRCGFIGEYELSASLRAIETSAINRCWDEARLAFADSQMFVTSLRIRLFSEVPAGRLG